MSKTANLETRQLKALGHKLKPVVTVGGNGLSDTVVREIDRALGDHELIKIKLAVGDKATRTAVAEELCEKTGARLIHSIGSIILVLRRSSQPDPRLSNLIRPL